MSDTLRKVESLLLVLMGSIEKGDADEEACTDVLGIAIDMIHPFVMEAEKTG